MSKVKIQLKFSLGFTIILLCSPSPCRHDLRDWCVCIDDVAPCMLFSTFGRKEQENGNSRCSQFVCLLNCLV